MDFQQFSLFLKHTKVKHFAHGLEQGKIFATKCPRCGVLYYPPKADCPHCLQGGLEWVPLEGPGKLLSFTSIFVTPAHFTPDLSCRAPFSEYVYHPAPVGIVELANGIKIMGWILGIPPERLRVGLELFPQARVNEDGRLTVVFVGGEER